MTDFSPRTLVSRTFAGDPLSAEKQSANLTRNFDRPIAEAVASLSAEAGNTRGATIQVVDRSGEPWPGRWLLAAWLATSDGGAPGGTQTTAWASGTVLATFDAHRAFLVLTEPDGTTVLNITVAGAATRYLHLAVLGSAENGLPVAFV